MFNTFLSVKRRGGVEAREADVERRVKNWTQDIGVHSSLHQVTQITVVKIKEAEAITEPPIAYFIEAFLLSRCHTPLINDALPC